MTDNKRGREWKERDEQYEGGRVGTARKSQAKQREQERTGGEWRGANRPQCAEPHDRRVTD